MILDKLFDGLVQCGRLTLIDALGQVRIYGSGGSPRVTVRLHDRGLLWRLPFNPSLALGEAYMNGTLTIAEGTLYDLLDLCTRSSAALAALPGMHLRVLFERPWRWLMQYNPVARARANVAHHYDLSGRLYDLFLDKDRQYSCAYFQNGDETIEEAQAKKCRHLAAKLLLKPGMRVLDIGSGWGGLAINLARMAGVDVTGITLSTNQLEVSATRAMAAGLERHVRFHMRDYRAETGLYDRIVSVGMFEHVGITHYRGFFETVKQRLKPGGMAVLHAIGRASGPGSNDAFLRKYIFPGSYAPALSEVLPVIERTGLWVNDIEILRLHYADTLRAWRQRFHANRAQARLLYDERFCRMWEYYLALCEVGFRNLDLMVFQIQLSPERDTVPLTRDYITDFERMQDKKAILRQNRQQI